MSEIVITSYITRLPSNKEIYDDITIHTFDLTPCGGDAMCNFALESLVSSEYEIYKVEFYGNDLLLDKYSININNTKSITLSGFLGTIMHIPLDFWFQKLDTPLYNEQFTNKKIKLYSTGLDNIKLKHQSLHIPNYTINYNTLVQTHGEFDISLDKLDILQCKTISFKSHRTVDLSMIGLYFNTPISGILKALRLTYTYEGLCRDVLTYNDLVFNDFIVDDRYVLIPNRCKYLAMIDILFDNTVNITNKNVKIFWKENNYIIHDSYVTTIRYPGVTASETAQLDNFTL
jgi:hypothetical protein